MTETTLNEILEDICTEEVNEYEKVKPRNHFFSFRHCNAMEEILYPHRCSEEIPDKRRKLPVHKRFLILTIVIIMAVMSITAGGAMLRGFNRKEFPDHTMLFAVNGENSPKTIENVYYFPDIPEEYVFDKCDLDITDATTYYFNKITNRYMTLVQNVKNGYMSHFNTEYNDFEELDINGNYALYIDFSYMRRDCGLIVWDNGDYILQIAGDFVKEQLINLAKSAKI